MRDLVKSQIILITITLFAFLFIVLNLSYVLAPFIISFVIAHCLEPYINYFTHTKSQNRYVTTTLACCLFFSVFFIFLYFLIPILISELTNILNGIISYKYTENISEISIYLQPVENRFPQLYKFFQDSMSSLTSKILEFSKQIFASIINSGKLIFKITTIFLITPILTFYLCLDIQKIKKIMISLPPKKQQNDIKQLCQSINKVIGKFFYGQLIVCIIFSSYYALTFSLIGIKFALALGVLTGFSLFIPLFGISTSLLITMILTFITSHNFSFLGYLGCIFTAGIITESTIITPKLIGRTLSLHPLWILLGLFCCGTLFGFFGILFALPLTAVISVVIRFVFHKYKNSKIYNY